MEIYNLISFSGIFVLMGVAWLVSESRRTVNWRVILWGTALPLLFALFLFIVPAGARAFIFINDVLIRVLDSAAAGARFLFGRLALPPGATGDQGETSLGFILAFQAFPTIVFFSALMSILYYCNILPRIIRGFAWVFTKLLKVSGAESLCTAANIFVGVESALVIKPHLAAMTRSELAVVLTSGMATVASNVLALYVFSLQSAFPMIAGHLVSASIIAAPCALVMSKIIIPEREVPSTLGMHISPHYKRDPNLAMAVIQGANDGIRLIVGIVALLLAVLGLVALVDLFLASVGGWINDTFQLHADWTLKGILGWLFYPFALAIGVPTADASLVAKLIGERAVVTEVTAYRDLAVAMSQGVIQHPRSAVLAAYALCGFAHVASMAIFIGGTAALAPERAPVLAAVGFRSLIAATLACLMTACIAGTFLTRGSILIAG
jgi:concentrative nucleoside transporter, CNT family